MSRLLRIAAMVALACVSAAAYADRGAEQAKAFMNIYTICLAHLDDFEKLREKLASLPKLPPEKAANFLLGRSGNAWPVPDKSGYFVLSLLRDRNECAVVHAREADTALVKAHFRLLTAFAPPPFKSAEISKEGQRGVDETGETVFYGWHTESGARSIVFGLTTDFCSPLSLFSHPSHGRESLYCRPSKHQGRSISVLLPPSWPTERTKTQTNQIRISTRVIQCPFI